MTNLIDLLKGQLEPNLVEELSQQVGINDQTKTAAASNAIFSFLTNALAKNTQSTSGTSALSSALDRDHDGSVLDDLAGLFMGNGMLDNRTTNGAGILNHLLGYRQSTAIDMIAGLVGLDKSKTALLAMKLAPMVLGMVGKMKKTNHLNENQLSDFLQESAKTDNKAHGQSSIFSRLLDADGDGNMMDDVASMGLKALGSYFLR